MTGKRKFTYNLLQSICNDDNVNLLLDYSTMYLTRDTRIIFNLNNKQEKN